MRTLYYDCFMGISGDMHMGAMLGLGVPEVFLRSELAKLGIESDYELNIFQCIRAGISATRAEVISKGSPASRRLTDIEKLYEKSTLDDSVKQASLKSFRLLAEAEAKVHGTDVNNIHFHEVGATDAIIDITAAAVCLAWLRPDKIIASPVQLGGGFVNCAHGVLPVPVPAVLELLSGVPVKSGLVPHETTTPTGAAILKTYAHEFSINADFTLRKTGYGAGGRNLGVPNVLRATLGNIQTPAERQYLIETNIDDMNPELYGWLEERLFAAGARDVFKTPIVMKKGRPAVQLSILTDASAEQAVLDTLFTESSTIGVRRIPVEKIVLARSERLLNTAFGEIRIKEAVFNDKIKYKAEYEDVRSAALKHNVPINEVYKAVAREYDK